MNNISLSRPRSPPKMVLLNCKYDLTKMCRSCSSNKENVKHVSLFQTVKIDNNKFVIADMLKQCTSLKIELGDGLPIMICYQCISDLITTYNFIRKCKRTDESIRQYIFNDNSESLNALQDSNNKDINENPVEMEKKTNIIHEINPIELPKELEDIKENISDKEKDRSIPPLVMTKGIVPLNTFCIAVQDKNRKIRNVVINRNKVTHLNVEENNIKTTSGRLLKINNLNLLVTNIPKTINKKNIDCTKELDEHDHDVEHIVNHVENEQEQEKENSVLEDDIGELPNRRDKNIKVRRCSYNSCKKRFKFIKDSNFEEVLQEYKKHVNSHYNDEGFWCDICPRRVTAAQFLETHNKYCHKGRQCRKCKAVFHDREEYFEHKKTHKILGYTCKYCNKRYKTYRCYLMCEQKHEGKLERLKCDQCDKTYKIPYDLVVHKRRVHDKLNRYLCTVCGRNFFFQYELERHEVIHKTERKFYKCELCDKQLLTKFSLTKHVISIHGKEERRFECSLCPKKFLFKTNYTYHMRRHFRGNYRFKCQFCDKLYYSKRELKYHILTHTGERPHKCPYCAKTYRRPQALTEHIRMHTGERPYTCEICSMTFARQSIWKKHKRLCLARANGERRRRNSKKSGVEVTESISVEEMQMDELHEVELETEKEYLAEHTDEQEYLEQEEYLEEYETEEITEEIDDTEELHLVKY